MFRSLASYGLQAAAILLAVYPAAAGELVRCDDSTFSDLGCANQAIGKAVASKSVDNTFRSQTKSLATPAVRANRRTPQTTARRVTDDSVRTRCRQSRSALRSLREERRKGYDARREKSLDRREATLRAESRRCRANLVRGAAGRRDS